MKTSKNKRAHLVWDRDLVWKCIVKSWAVKYRLPKEKEDSEIKKLTKET